jgi:cytochrome c oxidase assembly protein subunit 15
MDRQGMSDPMRPVRTWLWCLAALVALIVVVGGTTRLTGSGLSIVEWRPVTGVIPPLSTEAWQAAFEDYQQIPQYAAQNLGISLDEFKVLYWWEWMHRLLGRLAGVVFLIPFVVFWRRRLIDRPLAWKLGGLFVLGGIQGAVGWWMVASGLAERTDVSQYRLAAHLTLASVILAMTVAIAVSLKPGAAVPAARRLLFGARLLVVLNFVQIFLGALVAKTGAGLTFNTWPLIDGEFIPSAADLLAIVPWWKNFFENVLTVQFDHRMVAYALFVLAALHVFDVLRTGPVRAARGAAVVFALTTVQAMLGVVTLVHGTPLALALAHQVGAIAVLVAATVHAERLGLGYRGAMGKSNASGTVART